MRVCLFLSMLLAVGCATSQKPCLSGIELGVFGSESNGDYEEGRAGYHQRGSQTRDTNDVTVGGSATAYFDFTGACVRQ